MATPLLSSLRLAFRSVATMGEVLCRKCLCCGSKGHQVLSYLAARYSSSSLVLHTWSTVYQHGHVETKLCSVHMADIRVLHHIIFGTGGSSPGPVAHRSEHKNSPVATAVKMESSILFCLLKEKAPGQPWGFGNSNLWSSHLPRGPTRILRYGFLLDWEGATP